MYLKGIILAIFVFVIFSFSESKYKVNYHFDEKELLSEYGFFSGNIAAQQPVANVIPYTLNTPLFSDYAEKLRFIKIPQNEKITYNAESVLDFPIGTVIIKTFYYPHDFRNFSKGRKIMETRLLVNETEGWKALSYVWNEEQTDAYLEVAGERKDVQWIDNQGKIQKHEYVIPNINQCKGCHNYDEKMRPIGPSARQLNRDFSYSDVNENQLIHWTKVGLIDKLPPLNEIPKSPIWNNPQSGSLNDRARAWLDINCAHCHNEHGPAKTSGMFLAYNEKEPIKLGILKTPVAAGKGSGGRKFGIVPGKPEQSILIYRIESLDPGEMMPEVGRKLPHKEGIQLIKDWIKHLN